jgi:hypothetical protein
MAVPAETIHIDNGRAMLLCKRIRQNMTDARSALVELYEGKGWQALGYDSWRECVATEFGEHQRTLYRHLEAALVLREIEADPTFDTCDKNTISERALTSLAQAPEGTRAEVLKVATEASAGKPTEKVVKAAVEAKWAAPDATAAELVQTVVNGQAKADRAIERARAEGKIPAGVVVHVEDPGDDATTVDDVIEDHGEQAAKRDEIGEDEWLATLPLSGKLTGPQLRVFQVDAAAYRELEPHRKTFEHHLRRAKAAAVRKSKLDLGYLFRVFRLLLIQHPKDWRECPSMDRGGCGGSGQVTMVGQCPKCQGRGYILQ